MTVEEQLVLLRKREPVPTGPLAELRQRRLDVTRERLAKVEGIPEARLQVARRGRLRPRPRRRAPGRVRPRARAPAGARPAARPSRRRRAGASSSASPERATERFAILRAPFVAPRRRAVAHYVMLSSLSESGRKVLHARPGWIRKVNRELSRPGRQGHRPVRGARARTTS